jgi:hypothetical protein
VVLSKGYTKAYGFRGDGLKTYSVDGTHKYITRQSFPTISQYGGRNIPEYVRELGGFGIFDDVVIVITAIEKTTLKYIKILYEYNNTETFYIKILSADGVVLDSYNGYGFIAFSGFDSNLDHTTVVEIMNKA